MRLLLLPACLAISLTPAALCQSAAPAFKEPPQLTYDVSTVKPHDPADDNMSWGALKGTFSAINVDLRNLIAEAWGVRPDQVSGEPAWADDQHWDVTAKITEAQPEALKTLTNKDMQSMEQALLADRFHAQVHVEMRVGKVLNLLPSKTGIKLKALPPEKADDTTNNGPNARGSLWLRGNEDGSYEMSGHGIGIATLTDNIAANLQQTVIDKTGLPADAVYDFKLRFAPETGTSTSQNGDAVSIREALEQQLGLHLESTRAPVKTIVVDHVEKPTAN